VSFGLIPYGTIVTHRYVDLASYVDSAWLKGCRGGFLVWFLTIPNTIISGNIAYGAAWFSPAHRGEAIAFMIAALGIGQAAGLFSAISVRLSSAYATIQKQALTDALTGLPNHRAIMDQLEKELDRARRFDRPFSLLFFDADRFKHVNDTYGHGTGGAVLRQIGERGRESIMWRRYPGTLWRGRIRASAAGT
jgi:predicted signal transduction protein with EAL and GGDEF domain